MKIPNIAIKLGVLILLVIALQLPSNMLRGIIWERQENQQQVATELTASNSGAQTILGPVITVPYKLGNTNKTIQLLPKTLAIDGKLNVSTLKRSIYQFQTYQSNNTFTGQYDTSELRKLAQNGAVFGDAFLSIGITDARGIGSTSSITLNNQSFTFKSGARLNTMKNGVNASLLGLNLTDRALIDFNIALDVKGTGHLAYIPVGENTTLALSGNWPHPKFSGLNSPSARDIANDGFTASWSANASANNMENRFFEMEANNDTAVQNLDSFDTELIQTVDHYQQTERAVKYSILLIGMTFLCVFLFEVLRQLRVHPVQYALIGVALSVFYLLLLSLSEHIGFTKAYLIASLACIGQIGFYISHILHSLKRGIGFSIFLAMVYAAIYVLLSFDDFALMIGSIGLFIVITAVMALTRRLNWYAIGQSWETPKPATPAVPIAPVANDWRVSKPAAPMTEKTTANTNNTSNSTAVAANPETTTDKTVE